MSVGIHHKLAVFRTSAQAAPSTAECPEVRIVAAY
jgi:hypothetical protein